MSEFETFEVSITSLNGKQEYLGSSLQNVGVNETFQSLFDRLIEPFTKNLSISSDDISNNKSSITSSPSSEDAILLSPPNNHLSHLSIDEKIDNLDIKTIECLCYANNKNGYNGCNVSLKFNVHSISKRHNFLRIVYRIDIPSKSLTPTPSSSTNRLKQRTNKYSKVLFIYI